MKFQAFPFFCLFFSLISKISAVCPSNCLVCLNGNECETCSAGYRKESSQSCVKYSYMSISDCKNVLMEDDFTYPKCTECMSGYGLISDDSTKCLPCSLPGCSGCVLDKNYGKTCFLCNEGYSLQNDECIKCPENCATCNEQICLSCKNSSFILSSGTCVSITCGNLEGCSSCVINSGNKECTSCSTGYIFSDGKCTKCPNNCAQCDSFSCIKCSSGFYLNNSNDCLPCSENQCEECPNNECSTCKSGYLINKDINTCSPCASNCYECAETLDTCTKCKQGTFLSSGICLSCSEGCTSCTSKNYCQKCGLNKVMLINSSEITCINECPQSNLFLSEDNKCLTCNSRFSDCLECDSEKCYSYSCLGNSFLLEDYSGCDPCNKIGDISYMDTKLCQKIPSVMISMSLKGFVPEFKVSCRARSAFYFAFGLEDFLDENISLTQIQLKTGLMVSILIHPSSDHLNNLGWIGYGAIKEVINDKTFTLSTILKNSGEKYILKGFCVSYSGSKISASNKISWTQPSNGGSTIRVDVASFNYLASSSKTSLGNDLLSYLKLKRDFGSDSENNYDSRILISLVINISPSSDSVPKDDGIKFNNTIIEANTTNETNTTDTSETIYNTSFYFLPDYRITNDNFYLILKETIEDTSFISNFNQKVSNSASLKVKSVTINKKIEIQPKPIFKTTNVSIVSHNDTFNFNLTLTNTNGFIYLKLNYDYSTDNFARVFVEKNKIVNFEFSGLSKSTTYVVSFYASSENYPRLKTNIYEGTVKIKLSGNNSLTTTTGNNGNTSNFDGRNMEKNVFLVAWLFAIWIII